MNTAQESTSLSLTRRIPARRDDVFAAWSEPELLRRWWAPPGTEIKSLELDARVGGRYRIGIQHSDGEMMYVKGTFVEVVRPSRLVYTWAWEEDDGPGHESLVTIAFADHGAETEVTLTHERLASEESRDNHRKGWTGILDNLAATFAEKKA